MILLEKLINTFCMGLRNFVGLLCLFLSFHLGAQERYKTTLTAGPSIKIVSSSTDFDSNFVNVPDSEPETGFQAGGFFRIRVNQFYFQPELHFSRTKNQLTFVNFNNTPNFNPRSVYEFSSLEFPWKFGYFLENFRINGGPAFSFLLDANQFFLGANNDVINDFNRISIQFQLGIGLDLNNLLIDVSYEFGLSKIGENLRRLVGTEFDPKLTQFSFSVGLIVFEKKKRP